MASGHVWDDGPSGLGPITAGEGGTAGSALTALPVGVAHLEVTAGAGGVLAAALRAPDVLDLLAQALEGGVHLEVTVTDHVSIISPVVAATIVSLLLRWLGQEAQVVAAAGRTGGTRGSRRAGRTLCREGGEGGLLGLSAFRAGGHGQEGRRVGITGARCFQGWGAMGRQGWGTYSRTSITSATSRPRGTDGAWETIESIFARSTSRARGTLQGGSWLEKAFQKAGVHSSSGREAHLPLCLAQTPQPSYGLFPRKLCGRKWGGRGQRPHKVVHRPHSFLSSPAPDPSPERRGA